ncbi:MAG: 2-C-methyl-D-erythritol 2,4-cyclodiphosphate synthase [Candidatus Dadabacteria bacterium]|nr:MAG: 2-C-methyl-D-erythritol 2,4-cyclodiphosphate synthase [Candidatus Dadabacteria bacterium]
MRVGFGIDTHAFEAGRKLMLGGVHIPHTHGLKGHSDADALLHATIDAILGATGRGDIGCYFPDDSPEWKDADSSNLLTTVWQDLRDQGWYIVNLDATVITEAPRLRAYIDKIRENLGRLLCCNADVCNVKATTSERLGFIGKGEGITAHCVVLLSRDS